MLLGSDVLGSACFPGGLGRDIKSLCASVALLLYGRYFIGRIFFLLITSLHESESELSRV